MKRLGEALAYAYPEGGWLVQDDSDGKGPYLAEWTRPEPRPTEADIDRWCAALDARAAIAALESTVTQRRLREAALTTEGRAWLEGVDAQIAALRARL